MVGRTAGVGEVDGYGAREAWSFPGQPQVENHGNAGRAQYDNTGGGRILRMAENSISSARTRAERKVKFRGVISCGSSCPLRDPEGTLTRLE